jgi:hypothetical protein
VIGALVRGRSTRLPRMEPKTARDAFQWLKPTISKAVSERRKKR